MCAFPPTTALTRRRKQASRRRGLAFFHPPKSTRVRVRNVRVVRKGQETPPWPFLCRFQVRQKLDARVERIPRRSPFRLCHRCIGSGTFLVVVVRRRYEKRAGRPAGEEFNSDRSTPPGVIVPTATLPAAVQQHRSHQSLNCRKHASKLQTDEASVSLPSFTALATARTALPSREGCSRSPNTLFLYFFPPSPPTRR